MENTSTKNSRHWATKGKLPDYFKATLIFVNLCFFILPADLVACTVCVNRVTGSQGEAATWAVLALFLLITLVLAGFAGFFYYLWKKGNDHSGRQDKYNNLLN